MMNFKVESLESVVAPGKWQMIKDFIRGFIDGFFGL
ncbi:hypothetical protein EP10_001767 [Geobacillus icigianus]|uniref:Uncharacterized protein n=1 Tax=Geobacillus icigianus TaxID=1430331 RepID=A0ABU6BG95_9BACL|nr:hypothetical protein [Geobacillus icigianus]